MIYYSDTHCTIHLGDCEEIAPTLGRFDLLLTDPPYGIGFAAQPTTGQRKAGMKPCAWDDSLPLESLICEVRAMADRQVIWGGNYFKLPPSRCWLSWYKPDAPPSMGNVEYAWTNWDQNSRQVSQSIAATNPERLGHPTQKPLKIMLFCILQAGDSIRTIFDPFGGSCTTARAAKDLGLHCTIIEREERYCELGARRMSQESFNFEPAAIIPAPMTPEFTF